MQVRSWLPVIATVVALLLLAVAWQAIGIDEKDLERWSQTFEPFRARWWALPATLGVFVLGTLVMFPVLLLIFATGVVFGPWLGAAYALLGSLAAALVPFAIGRRLGRDRVRARAKGLVDRIERALERRGVIAIFLVRKVPAPFTLVNLVCGALGVTTLDFVVGTFLGMGTGVIVITVLGGHLLETLRDPDLGRIAIGVGLLFAPLVLALAAQRLANRRREQPT